MTTDDVAGSVRASLTTALPAPPRSRPSRLGELGGEVGAGDPRPGVELEQAPGDPGEQALHARGLLGIGRRVEADGELPAVPVDLDQEAARGPSTTTASSRTRAAGPREVRIPHLAARWCRGAPRTGRGRGAPARDSIGPSMTTCGTLQQYTRRCPVPIIGHRASPPRISRSRRVRGEREAGRACGSTCFLKERIPKLSRAAHPGGDRAAGSRSAAAAATKAGAPAPRRATLVEVREAVIDEPPFPAALEPAHPPRRRRPWWRSTSPPASRSTPPARSVHEPARALAARPLRRVAGARPPHRPRDLGDRRRHPRTAAARARSAATSPAARCARSTWRWSTERPPERFEVDLADRPRPALGGAHQAGRGVAGGAPVAHPLRPRAVAAGRRLLAGPRLPRDRPPPPDPGPPRRRRASRWSATSSTPRASATSSTSSPAATTDGGCWRRCSAPATCCTPPSSSSTIPATGARAPARGAGPGRLRRFPRPGGGRERRGPERSRAERRRRPTQRALRLHQELVEALDDFVFMADTSGRILAINRKARETLGFELAEVGAMTIWDLHPPEDKAKVERERWRIVETGASSFEVRLLTKSGKTIPTRGHVTYSPTSGTFQGVYRDISEEQLVQRAPAPGRAAARARRDGLGRGPHLQQPAGGDRDHGPGGQAPDPRGAGATKELAAIEQAVYDGGRRGAADPGLRPQAARPSPTARSTSTRWSREVVRAAGAARRDAPRRAPGSRPSSAPLPRDARQRGRSSRTSCSTCCSTRSTR